MLLSRANLEVAAFASSDSTRPALASVRVHPGDGNGSQGFTEATDGHKLVRVPLPSMSDEEWPIHSPAFEGRTLADPTALTLPAAGCKSVAKSIPKSKRITLPILRHAAIFKGSNGNVDLATTDLDTHGLASLTPIPHEYPDTSQVWPKDEEFGHAIAFNADYLAAICKFLSKHAADRIPAVTIRFQKQEDGTVEPGRAALLSCPSDDGDIRAILMPVKITS